MLRLSSAQIDSHVADGVLLRQDMVVHVWQPVSRSIQNIPSFCTSTFSCLSTMVRRSSSSAPKTGSINLEEMSGIDTVVIGKKGTLAFGPAR